MDADLWPWIERAIPSPVQYKWLREHFKRAAREVGLPDLRLHDLRHCFGQWATDAGLPEAKVHRWSHCHPLAPHGASRQNEKTHGIRGLSDGPCRT